jgi:hypothetical protein
MLGQDDFQAWSRYSCYAALISCFMEKDTTVSQSDLLFFFNFPSPIPNRNVVEVHVSEVTEALTQFLKLLE